MRAFRAHRTINTEHGASRNTCSDVLPSNSRLIPPVRLLPITTRSIAFSRVSARISSAGRPSATISSSLAKKAGSCRAELLQVDPRGLQALLMLNFPGRRHRRDIRIALDFHPIRQVGHEHRPHDGHRPPARFRRPGELLQETRRRFHKCWIIKRRQHVQMFCRGSGRLFCRRITLLCALNDQHRDFRRVNDRAADAAEYKILHNAARATESDGNNVGFVLFDGLQQRGAWR